MRILCLLFLIVCANASSAPLVPVVYRDDYVAVSAGIVDASQRMPRVGDVLTLRVAVHFSQDTTRISDLDDAFFERMFANQPEVRLLETDGMQQSAQADGLAVVEKHWRFQILNCPDASSNCPGTRNYSMPITILDYSVMGGADGRPSQRSARFRPWPEQLSLVSAFPGQLPEDAMIGDWIPASAMPMPATNQQATSLAPLPLAVGALLLLFSFLYRDGTGKETHGKTPVSNATRWRQVALTLDEASLSDAEWLDRYRRCLVWYLIDEEGMNPFVATTVAADSHAAQLLAEIMELVAVDHRERLLGRLHAVIGPVQTDGSGR